MSKSYRHEIGVGLIVLAAAALTGWMAMKVGSFGMGGHVPYTADFDDAAGLKNGASVSIAGVNVGKVDTLKIEQGQARLTLLVDPEIELHQDARALIRARSVLGEKYIAIEPGTVESGPLDGTHIRVSVGQVEIDQLLTEVGAVFDMVNAEQFGLAIDAIAAAFEQDPERPARIVETAEKLVDELLAAAKTAEPMIQEIQQSAEQIGSLSQKADGLVARGDRVLADLELAAGHLPTASEGLPVLVDDARAAAADLKSFVDGLNQQTAGLERIVHNLSEIDKWELRKLLREEGILLRLREEEVVVPDGTPFYPSTEND